MKKLLISKTEGVAEVVERVLSDEDFDLVLVVPRGSVLKNSVSNFRLIKREADSAGKTIAIESVDENILALAKAAEIRAAHPLFPAEGEPLSSSGSGLAGASYGERTGRKAAFSDILSRRESVEFVKPLRKRKVEKEKKVRVKIVSRPADESPPADEEDVTSSLSELEESNLAREKPRFSLPSRRLIAVVLVIVVFSFTGWLLSGRFASATITINLEKVPWEEKNVILADVSVSGINFDKNVIPAELFTTTKNLTHFFPASREEEVAEKARGRILIYNAFSSAPQVLVATTRFEAPDGKIFRITKQITVPGAQIKDGKIIPSSIEADIVADKAGEAYNVGPISRLSIPGFKGTPRYDGFYGEIKTPTEGGFIGKKRIPAAEDIRKGRERMEELLRMGLETTFNAGVPKEFKILDGASRIDITRLNVDASTNEKGEFSIFGEAKIRAIGFKESDLRILLETAAQNTEKETTFKELDLAYRDIKPDFDKGTLNFSLNAKGALWPKLDKNEFKGRLLGKKISEAQSLISSLPRFQGGKVSIWPIWLRSIPADPAKVKVVVE